MSSTTGHPNWRLRVLSGVGVLLLIAVGALVGKHAVFADGMRKTAYVSTDAADEVVLTWSGDPRTTETIQWRTAVASKEDSVRYRRAEEQQWQEQKAITTTVEDAHLENDKVCAHHTAEITGLEPGTAYVYEVGNGTKWASKGGFSTAPAQGTKLSFIYMGDVQVGYEDWGKRVRTALEHHPEIAFCTLAGDLENRGSNRNEWDAFFHGAEGAFNHVPFMPVLGNHDNADGGLLYRAFFELPKNGPKDVAPELAYAFEYANALFVVLNSNDEPEKQTAWLDEQLSRSKADWKFVSFHHPVYSPKANRDNSELRTEWSPLFDKYHVDMVLTGHDHSYMRTFPTRNGTKVANPADGTTYVVSFSGSKMYDQQPDEHSAVAFEKIPTYQIIDINGKQLTYRAYDARETVVDELVITK